MKNNKKIAILLAVYNGGKYLKEQIESVIDQTYTDWTLYIRDDQSTDNTTCIIESYCDKYPNIIQLKDNKGNLGCRYNFFELLERIDSEYYMFCDADDVWFADKVDISIERILAIEKEKGKNIPILVHTDYTVVDSNLTIISDSYFRSSKLDPDKFMTLNQAGIMPLAGGSLMLFNKLVKNISFPIIANSSMYDAWILLKVLQYKGIVSLLHKPTKYYRQHENNFYGVITQKRSLKEKYNSFVKMNKITANNLKNFGWGGYLKFVYFKIFVVIKKHILKLVWDDSSNN